MTEDREDLPLEGGESSVSDLYYGLPSIERESEESSLGVDTSILLDLVEKRDI